jgi:phosphoribosylanthranilate isomerase
MPIPASAPEFIVKVCGVTDHADAQAALDAGANALGFNFYPKSPRFLSHERAADIVAKLSGGFLRVGIFVNPTAKLLADTAGFLDRAQIHGAGGASLPTSLPIWRAVSAGSLPTADSDAEAWVLDAFTPAFGGSGQTFDWCLAAGFPQRTIIAGGLDASNVSEAIRIANPWGVDSCSRLESSPGKKDHARVAAFVEKAWAAFHTRQAVNI